MDNEKLGYEGDKKFNIKLKSKPKDGVILQLHHTVRDSHGECRRIRFSLASFDDTHETLACADNVGNIFILDFSELKFWKLPRIGPCTAMHFFPNKLDTLTVTTAKKYKICFIDTESGDVSLTLSGHSAPVKHISFSNFKTNNLLTASPAEAILWELNNYTKYFTLNTYLGAQIQQIMFSPASDYLVACFQNDTIQIWKHANMKSVKQIIPNELKHMKSIAFTLNGRAMAMAGLNPTLILFSMDTWKAIKSIDLTRYKITGVQQIAFIPQVFDGGANKILCILSSDCIIHLLDLESLFILHTISPESSCIKKFVISPTGKYFLCILQQGEVNIYNSLYLMEEVVQSKCEIKEDPCTTIKKITGHPDPSLKREIEQKMRVCMDSARLRRILMQYGEYPEKFRSLIWQSLLNTPQNKVAYAALIDKGIHPAYKDIEKQFTIHSSVTLKSLKRLLSCLAHWCPLFSVVKYLPGLIFPFVKVLQRDPLLLFECVATVLINYCQLWFEYAPFPPISILSIIENVLAEHDQQLLDHFCKLGVTSQTYALKILETAFSEILSRNEWLILWDHILSNEPAFTLMAVVSYNIVQKNVLKKLTTHEQIENFFQMQNPIDKKTFLKKAYVLLNDTPSDIHPKRFFKPFVSLEKGDCYQQFTGYPKATICLKLAKNERKKAMTTEKYTLKKLTTITQEKEIEARLKNNDNTSDYKSEESNNCEDNADVEEFNEVSNKTLKKLNNDYSHTQRKDNEDVKKELIDKLIYPTSVELLASSDAENCKKPKECTHGYKKSKTRKKTTRHKRNNNQKKDNEKLRRGHSNSDLSD